MQTFQKAKEYQRRTMEKEEFLRSGHGREERNEEMRKLDSDQEHDHIIRSKVS